MAIPHSPSPPSPPPSHPHPTPSKDKLALPITVPKPTPYTYDLGLLLSTDPNPLPFISDTSSPSLEHHLAATARDGAQALLNQLLGTCPITSTAGGVLVGLPAVEMGLPREKPLPPPQAQTKWTLFAAKKGIKPKTAEQRRKLVYDEERGDWVRKWGYKGRGKEGEGDWIVEVDERGEREDKEGREGRGKEGRGGKEGMGRQERKEAIRRQARRERRGGRRG